MSLAEGISLLIAFASMLLPWLKYFDDRNNKK